MSKFNLNSIVQQLQKSFLSSPIKRAVLFDCFGIDQNLKSRLENSLQRNGIQPFDMYSTIIIDWIKRSPEGRRFSDLLLALRSIDRGDAAGKLYFNTDFTKNTMLQEFLT
jgi:hypothetical protein